MALWRRAGFACTAVALILVCAWIASPAALRAPVDQSTGVDLARLARLDDVIARAIRDGHLPGAVVVVGRGDAVVWRKAYGLRAVRPVAEPMTVDTVFDLASLTKVVATTTAAMLLVEEGRLRLSDRVAAFIPEFAQHDKSPVTIRDVMTHMSGLRPDVDLTDDWLGYDTAIELATRERLTQPPGERFVYSDIGFFLLAEIVARVSGQSFDRFARERIFAPLQMRDTVFTPSDALRPRVAPTEACTPYGWPCDGPGMTMLRGTVHDPTARRMHGVAGHAGLFSTADDLTTFARMLLGGGAVDGTRILAPLTVARMTRPSTPDDEPNVRGLGWDIDSAFSANRGDLFPVGSFGHTGFTGTSIWIDPSTRTFVIFLSSRLHPDGDGDVTALRARVASVVAAALVDGDRVEAHSASPVRTGADVLRADGARLLEGRRVALLTNHTGVTADGVATIDVLAGAPDVDLVALLSPEHGIRGVLDQQVPSTTDARTGLPIHSLYGATRRPTDEMLDGIDAIVIDLQDIGTRFYTYMTSMAYVMEAAAARGIDVVVLDRPNPIGGATVEGPALDATAIGFTGYFGAMPIRHGMTIGELAKVFNAEAGIGANLTVVALEGWRRDVWFDQTGLTWINPSPNMRSLAAATLYPGLGAFEHTNISVGRGTDRPFEQIGAPWIDGRALARTLTARAIPGVSVYPVRFTPTSSSHAGQPCQGVAFVITDRRRLRPVRLGVELASALRRLHPDRYELDAAARLFGSRDGLARIAAGEDPLVIVRSWAAVEQNWRALVDRYRMY